MKYHFKIHKDKKVYWAECLELDGCFTQATTLKELNKNMQEALNLYIEEPEDCQDLAPLPDNKIKKTKTVVEVMLDPKIALAFLVRRYRVKNKMTQQKAADAMGFDNVYSYQRLESGKANPSLNVMFKLKKIFPDISIDFIFA
jgi:predicted RNase H-like HicB family nuclease